MWVVVPPMCLDSIMHAIYNTESVLILLYPGIVSCLWNVWTVYKPCCTNQSAFSPFNVSTLIKKFHWCFPSFLWDIYGYDMALFWMLHPDSLNRHVVLKGVIVELLLSKTIIWLQVFSKPMDSRGIKMLRFPPFHSRKKMNGCLSIDVKLTHTIHTSLWEANISG